MGKKAPQTVEEYASIMNYHRQFYCLFNRHITEYDMSKANINVLRAYGAITEEEYNKLYILPKIDREREIGMKIRANYQFQEYITEGVSWAKYMFLSMNNVDLDSIIRIANDAIYVDSLTPCMYTSFTKNDWTLTFVPKHHFSTYMLLKDVLFFFGDTGSDYDIEIIGIKDENLKYHEPFIMFLCKVVDTYYNGGKKMALRYINDFIYDYLHKNLDMGYYREFRSDSCWLLNMPGLGTYRTIIQPDNPSQVNISYNYDILRSVYSYILAA